MKVDRYMLYLSLLPVQLRSSASPLREIITINSKKNHFNTFRSCSMDNLPSFLLVGMNQNVCSFPGSVLTRFVWKHNGFVSTAALRTTAIITSSNSNSRVIKSMFSSFFFHRIASDLNSCVINGNNSDERK